MKRSNFDRIVIYGTPGSGKSTLAKKLGAILDTKHIHLDDVFWYPNWTFPTNETFRSKVKEAVIGDQWIVDGNYSRVRDMILPNATFAIIIDLPLYTILWRILARTISRNTKLKLITVTPLPLRIEESGSREDIAYGIYELSRMAIKYKLRRLKELKKEVSQTIGEKNLLCFYNQEGIDHFVIELEKKIKEKKKKEKKLFV